MKTFDIDERCTRESNVLQLKLEPHKNTRCSKVLRQDLLAKKSKFNDPLLPKHVDEKTVFGINTKSEISASDVIFPNKISGEVFIKDASKTDLYKISHHHYKTGEQLNRNYSTSFDPNYRYGKSLKRLPAGIWFKNNIKNKSMIEKKNIIPDYIRKATESKCSTENKTCRYPYIDSRQGKFSGRSYLSAWDILTGNEPDEKEFEFIEYLSAVNKIKRAVKKRKCNLKELHEEYKSLDKELTGWLPLEQVYKICYQHQIKPEKKLFNLALNSIHAINNINVQYDVFMDLLDPNVMFSPYFERDDNTEPQRFIPTYKNDYGNKPPKICQPYKKFENNKYTPAKPIVLAHQDCFGSETDVKTLLNPTIFSNYGLTYRDFYIGRNKDVIKKLFQDVGVNLPNDIFDVVWNNAYKCDGVDNKVSVEMFRQALQKIASRTINYNDDDINI